jgi:hypothetical protein
MRERGLALLIAVAAVAGLGVISLTGFALARMERASGVAAIAEVQARGAADAALADAMSGWPAALTPFMPGQEVGLGSVLLPGPALGRAVLRNLGGPVFLIRTTGVRPDAAGVPLASVAAELLVQLDSGGGGGLIRPRKYPLGWRLLP